MPLSLSCPTCGTRLRAPDSALGRTLLDLNRAAPEVGRRVVTVSPDVSSSTNLGGWVNKVGVWSHEDRRNWFADDPETILHWRERPSGQHIELGIAETNLVGAIGELGATWSRWGQPLLPMELRIERDGRSWKAEWLKEPQEMGVVRVMRYCPGN